MDEIDKLKERIELLSNSANIEKITKGFSNDRKYKVQDSSGTNYLLRVGDIDRYERKFAEYEIYNKLAEWQIRAPRPVSFGKLDELGLCYYLLTYIEGVDARENLPSLSEDKQYTIGLEAGKELWQMNEVVAPAGTPSWYVSIMKKTQRYIEAYKACGIVLANDDKIIQFIEKNAHSIKLRPSRFQHDDFHVGNLIVNEKGFAGVIDFDRYDWGDPYFDFVKLALFSRETSVPFSIGQVDGYFHNQIPEDFWMLYSVYTAMTIFSAVVWTIDMTPDKLDEMLNRLNLILDDHKYFEQTTPAWWTANRVEWR